MDTYTITIGPRRKKRPFLPDIYSELLWEHSTVRYHCNEKHNYAVLVVIIAVIILVYCAIVASTDTYVALVSEVKPKYRSAHAKAQANRK